MEYSYKHGDKLILEDDVDSTNAIGVENLWSKVTVGVEYGISDRVTITCDLPYHVNVRYEGVKNNYYESHGFGDLTAGVRYWFLEPDREGFNVFAELDVRFPTGKDDEMWKGKYKKAYVIPGSGQWGLLPSAGFHWGLGDFTLTGGVGAVFSAGESNAGYESADVGTAALALSWIPLELGEEQKTLIGLSVALMGIWIPEKDERDGVKVANTGGTWYYLAPTVFFSPDGGNFSVYLSIPVTLDADVHSLQCYEDYSVSFGMEYRF